MWCTPLAIARAVGPWDLDPFSNPRSHVEARIRCMLEDGGDGFGDRSEPGAYRFGGSAIAGVAREDMRVWIQPPYDDDFPMRALAHYGHTRFCALLRFDPRCAWWRAWYRRARLVVVPYRCNFEPPPGVTAPGSTFPHALYYRDPSDVTPAILRLGVAWRTGNP